MIMRQDPFLFIPLNSFSTCIFILIFDPQNYTTLPHSLCSRNSDSLGIRQTWVSLALGRSRSCAIFSSLVRISIFLAVRQNNKLITENWKGFNKLYDVLNIVPNRKEVLNTFKNSKISHFPLRHHMPEGRKCAALLSVGIHICCCCCCIFFMKSPFLGQAELLARLFSDGEDNTPQI